MPDQHSRKVKMGWRMVAADLLGQEFPVPTRSRVLPSLHVLHKATQVHILTLKNCLFWPLGFPGVAY